MTLRDSKKCHLSDLVQWLFTLLRQLEALNEKEKPPCLEKLKWQRFGMKERKSKQTSFLLSLSVQSLFRNENKTKPWAAFTETAMPSTLGSDCLKDQDNLMESLHPPC